MPLDWDTPVQYVRGVGPRRAAILAKADIHTVEDLLFHLPLRHEDRSQFLPIRELQEGEPATIRVRVVQSAVQRTRRRGFVLFRATVEDDTGSLPCVWFNQPYLKDILEPGRQILLFGAPGTERRSRRLQLENPSYELVDPDDEAIHAGRVVPVHKRVGKVSPKALRAIVHEALQALEGSSLADPLPEELRQRHSLPDRLDAFRQVHFPSEDGNETGADLSPGLRRLAFEELFLLELGLARRRQGLDEGALGRAYPATPHPLDRARDLLPFELTQAQERAVAEIAADLERKRPMHRLLQGDVGSGKTVVALLAMLQVIEGGGQALLMAPTELLAEQHARSLGGFLEATDLAPGLLTASLRAGERRALLGTLASGMTPLVVGTHALLSEDLRFRELGLVVVDEQHRFGVLQRAALREKGGNPHVLVMTATPIPRSLALTLYGDLDLSVMDELPPGRPETITAVRGEDARRRVYAFLEDEMKAGRQVFVVYPQVEETEETDLKAATEGAEALRRRFPSHPVGLVHGRLGREERDGVMRDFRNGELRMLVATTVVEVGVDVPNATVMVVEHAERFGLSQLHQLRGRVGRGTAKAWCILMRAASITPEAERRLSAMEETSDGFVIAERDLEIRGPGEFFGTRQSGLPPLRAANLVRDRRLLETARSEAFGLLEQGPLPRELEQYLRRTWGDRFGLIEVG